jgi:hypothetical protein
MQQKEELRANFDKTAHRWFPRIRRPGTILTIVRDCRPGSTGLCGKIGACFLEISGPDLAKPDPHGRFFDHVFSPQAARIHGAWGAERLLSDE